MTTSVSPRAARTLNPTRQQLDELDALLQRMLELPVHPLDKPEPAKLEGPSAALGQQPSTSGELPTDSEPRPPTSGQPTADSRQRIAMPPISYTVVETASPRPLPPASGFEPRPPMTASRLAPVALPEAPAAPPVPETREAEAWVPLRSTWQPSASTWPPLAESWHQAHNKKPPLPRPRPSVEPPPEPTPLETPELAATIEPPAPLPKTETSLSIPDPAPRTQAADAPLALLQLLLLPLVWFNQGFDACLTPLGAPGHWLCGRGRVVLGFIGLTCLAAALALALSMGMGWSR
jgi:hypothetical protein